MSTASSDPAAPSVVPLARRPLNAWWLAPLSVFAVGVIYFASQIIGGAVVYLYPLLKHWTSTQTDNWINNNVTAQFLYILIAEALTLAGLYAVLKMYRWQWRDIGLVRPKWLNLGWGLSAVIPYYVLYILIVDVVSKIVPSLQVDQKQDLGFNSVHGVIPLALTFISLVVLPPFVEEIAMRGFLYSGLKKWLPRITAALLVSALFGAAHLAEGGSGGPLWIGAIDTFTLSLVLCFLREKTGSLWAGITLHAAKNFIAFVSLYIIVAK